MRRGEVRWGRLEPRSGSEQKGHRPVVIVSHDGFNKAEAWRSVIVVPLSTSQRRHGPTVVALSAAKSGLPRDSFALCHQITTLDRTKLDSSVVAHLDDAEMKRIGVGIVAACDLRDAAVS